MSRQSELAQLGRVFDNSALSNRNLIINGAMQVAQRGTSVSNAIGAAYNTTDRFQDIFGLLGTWTSENSSDAPDGFSNSHKLTCTTAAPSPAAGTFAIMSHMIEAQNLQRLAYGTSSAKTMTLSLWVKSNKTGGASVDMYQPDNSNRLWSAAYTINSANTWEYKTFVVPADTSGLINNDNGQGLGVSFWLNSGSDFTGGSHQTTWAAYTAVNRNVNNLGVGGAVNDYFAITGVQLEVGDTATPFEHRSYGQELALCQRYCQISLPASGKGNSSGTLGAWLVPFSPRMRSLPSVTLRSLTYHVDEYWAAARVITGISYLYGYGETGNGVGVVAAVPCNAFAQLGLEAGAFMFDAEL